MPKTLILGVGNYLLSDDGLSVHVLERLVQTERLPEEIEVVDGGTCGLDLLQFLEGITNLIIVDAVNAGKEPGTIIRLSGEQVPAYLSMKISPHDIGLPDLLATAKLRDLYPPQRSCPWRPARIVGCQCGPLTFGRQQGRYAGRDAG